MTPAKQDQINACKRLLSEGHTPADLRHLGYAEAAIQAAIDEAK